MVALQQGQLNGTHVTTEDVGGQGEGGKQHHKKWATQRGEGRGRKVKGRG